MLNKNSVLSQLSVGMGNIRKLRGLFYLYFLQTEKRISFYEFLWYELGFWEGFNLTKVLWAGQLFIIWIFLLFVSHSKSNTNNCQWAVLNTCQVLWKEPTISEGQVVTIRPLYIRPVKSAKWLESGTSLTVINIGG